MSRHICKVCGELAINRAPKNAGGGWLLNAEAKRLRWSHLDGEALCPEMTSKGYQPSMPANS